MASSRRRYAAQLKPNTLGLWGDGLKQLDDYYRKHHIAAEEFACSYAADCSRGATDFVEAREPLVGDLYEKRVLPRLLIVSLDPATDMVGRDPQHRRAGAVLEWEARQPRPVNGGPEFKKQAHWYQTYEFAHRLLAPIARERGVGTISFSQMYRYFAHTNSAKCKDTGVGTAQAAARIFQNCSHFIPGEVVALEPDIVVTQGKYARESIASLPVLLSASTASGKYHADVVDLSGRPAIRFETHHPNRKDNSYRNEVAEAWSWYAKIAAAFSSGGNAALTRDFGFTKP